MCVGIRSSLHSVRFGQLLRRAHKRIVNIGLIKTYIERNNIQVELMRFHKIATLLTLPTLKRACILSRLTCLQNWPHCYP